MTLDFTGLLYGPIYDVLGVEVTITPTATSAGPATLTAIDKTAGVEVDGGEAGVATILPAAVIRAADLADAGLTRSDLRKASLVMNGSTWRINATRPKPSPGGEADGELFLFLTAEA